MGEGEGGCSVEEGEGEGEGSLGDGEGEGSTGEGEGSCSAGEGLVGGEGEGTRSRGGLGDRPVAARRVGMACQHLDAYALSRATWLEQQLMCKSRPWPSSGKPTRSRRIGLHLQAQLFTGGALADATGRLAVGPAGVRMGPQHTMCLMRLAQVSQNRTVNASIPPAPKLPPTWRRPERSCPCRCRARAAYERRTGRRSHGRAPWRTRAAAGREGGWGPLGQPRLCTPCTSSGSKGTCSCTRREDGEGE